MNKKIISKSLKGTKKFAYQIAADLKGGEVICLYGELGTGKTHFTKYLGEAMGISASEILSPTFVYWRKHEGDEFLLNHFDFYRIEKVAEVDNIGFEEAVYDDNAISVIEWADRVTPLLPKERIEIFIKKLPDGKRQFKVVKQHEET